ncbi:MAG: FAD-binding oxidoreductase [Oscillospiraceae bacterium]|nr:FAD-binding oxidoreductase [Oscillospiraceae bacterium]
MEFRGFMNEFIRLELEDIVGRENVSTNMGDKLAYATDYFWVPRMIIDRGGQPALPDCIVRPASAEEVSKVLKIANYYKIPVQTWGGGSGSQGGALPMAGGILLDVKRMDKLIDINTESGYITCETGMIFQTLEWYANERGYSVMHLPSCLTCCTVGGALAHNGIGILSTKYGKIDDQVLSVEVVLPNGDIINTLPVPKHSSGPNLLNLFVGSEGCLGIMTKARFKITKLPEVRRHHAFLFNDMSTGYNACREIVQTVKPSIMRLFDEAETVSIIKQVIGFEKKGSFLNLTVEGKEKIVAAEEEYIMEIAEKYGAQYLGSEYGEKWFDNRITFFYPGITLNNPKMFGTLDTTATYDNIQNVYWAMKKAIEAYPGVKFISHSSHWYEWGCMNYSRFIIENPPEDTEEAIRLHNSIWNDGIRAAIANGGVINDHHGVGLKLSRLMKENYGPAMQVLEGLKKELDPNGIMNPYKLGL